MRRLPGFAMWLLVGCAGDPGLLCDRHAASSDEGRYCGAHRNAVVRFVREGADEAARRDRLGQFKALFVRLEKLDHEDAVTAAVEQTNAMPEFIRRYEQEHFWAHRDTNLIPQTRLVLMKDGFRHAIHELERELGIKSP